MAGRGKLLAVLGDEDTVTGFLLGGVGELDKHRKPNFLVVEKETSITEIEETFRPYDATKDSILRRAKGMFTAEDLR
ncbi:V-type proton ATPase subunit F [Alligator sinensis]|uniref:V-type proton ATPase subunit F n=1 Tax=Alligator sinensis TaxID=38654 RepID=A0A1U7SKT5_ALLSI|nr:V-type proton ATPase subunit F [Alligator sinensis]